MDLPNEIKTLKQEVKTLNNEIFTLRDEFEGLKLSKESLSNVISEEVLKMKKHLIETTGYIGIPERKYRGE